MYTLKCIELLMIQTQAKKIFLLKWNGVGGNGTEWCINSFFIIRLVSWWKYPFLDGFQEKKKHFKDHNSPICDILLDQSPFNEASEIKEINVAKTFLLLGWPTNSNWPGNVLHLALKGPHPRNPSVLGKLSVTLPLINERWSREQAPQGRKGMKRSKTYIQGKILGVKYV